MTQEDEIFEKLNKGDPAAAGELAELYYGDILRYCLFHVPDRSLAQDAVQETFLRVFRYFDGYTHRGTSGLSSTKWLQMYVSISAERKHGSLYLSRFPLRRKG